MITKAAGKKLLLALFALIIASLAGRSLLTIWDADNSPVSRAADVQRNIAPSAVIPPSNEKRFSFYEMLQEGKESSATPEITKAVEIPAHPPIDGGSLHLQVGAYQSATEAESQKARLALIGIETNVLNADVPGKGKVFRVVIGPLISASEQSRIRGQLNQGGVTFVEIRKAS